MNVHVATFECKNMAIFGFENPTYDTFANRPDYTRLGLSIHSFRTITRADGLFVKKRKPGTRSAKRTRLDGG